LNGTNSIGGTGNTYEWFLNPLTTPISSSITTTVSPAVGTNTYLLVVTNGPCVDTDTMFVTTNALPVVDAGVTVSIPMFSTTSIGGNPTSATATTFSWSPLLGLDNASATNPTSSTTVTTIYTVTVTDANTFTLTQASRTTSGNVTNRRNTIRASGNVTSVTDNGTGDYTVNFTTAMPDANYSYQYGLENETTNANSVNKILLGYNNGRAAGSLRVQVQYILSSTTTAFDLPAVCISVFR
jgi:hypothetical protein